jgi:dolichyl-phosphate-mannose-protein mannosyltransferase
VAIELGRRRASATLVRGRFVRAAVIAPLAVAGLTLVSILVRFALARRIPTPLFFADELIYSEFAKSFADTGQQLFRDGPAEHFGPAYPILVSPAWFAESTETSYVLAKAINAVVMTLAVIPIFLWARRLVSPALSVVAVALVLFMPVFVYTGTLMTENLAFPAFLLACFAIALALERPSVGRQFLALAAIAAACSVRIQAVVLVLVLLTAILLGALFSVRSRGGPMRTRSLLAELGLFRLSFAVLAAGAVGYVVVKAGEGTSLVSDLGAYAVVGETHYSVREAARWIVYHYAELFFSVGVVPASAFIVLFGLAWSRRHTMDAAERAFLAVAAAVLLWLVIEVGVFASHFTDGRIEERNMVYAAPLLLLALLLWLDRGLPRPPGLSAAAALVPAALLITLPLESLVNVTIVGDTFGFLPLLRLADILSGGLGDVRIALALGVIGAGVCFAAFPRRFAAFAFPAGAALFLLLSSYVVFGSVRDYSRNLRAQTFVGDPRWVDKTIGTHARAAFIFGGSSDLNREATYLWENEFWNRSIRTVYNLGVHERSSMPETNARVDRSNGLIAVVPPAPITEPYAVVSRDVRLSGRLLAANGPLALYRLKQPPRLATATDGVYGDGWTGADAAYSQYDGPPGRTGTIRVIVSRRAWAGPDVPSKVEIDVKALRPGRAASPRPVAPRSWVAHTGEERSFQIPAPQAPFRVRIHVDPTFSPSQFGFPDARQLGVQVSFHFEPR